MLKTILVADNNPTLRRGLIHILNENGWQVCGEAVDGQDAVEKTQRLRPDLVVLDLSMPVLDGLQTARILKRLTPEVRLVLFTVYGQDQFIERECLASGISAVVSKADGVRNLISTLQSVLSTTGIPQQQAQAAGEAGQ